MIAPRLSTVCVLAAMSIVSGASKADAQVQVTSWTPIQEGPAITLVVGHASGTNASRDLATRFDLPIAVHALARLEVGKDAWDFSGTSSTREPSSGRVAVTRVVASVIRTRLAGPYGPSPFYAGFGFGVYHFGLRGDDRLPRPWRYGVHGLVGFEAPIPNTRVAINGEVQLHLPKGTFGSVPYGPMANMSLGLKIRM